MMVQHAFMSDTATVLSAPDSSTMASCAASASNLLGAVSNGRPVSAATCAATALSKPTCEARGHLTHSFLVGFKG